MGQRVDAAQPQTQELPERRHGELHQGRDRGDEGARRSRSGATLAEPGRSETYFPAQPQEMGHPIG